MNYLKEMPAGTIWPHLIDAIQREARADIQRHAQTRMECVARGAETPELAATLFSKYAEGMAAALSIVGIDSNLQATTDQLVHEIDPDFAATTRARWAARPARLAFTSVASSALG